MRRCTTPVPIAQALRANIQRLGIAERIKEGLVIYKWESMVGPEIARIAVPLLVKNGVLWIRVKNNIWANELSLFIPNLMKKIARQIGKDVVKEIRFKVDSCILERSDGECHMEQASSEEDNPGSGGAFLRQIIEPEDLKFADSICKAIADDRLRQTFSNFILTARAIQKHKTVSDK